MSLAILAFQVAEEPPHPTCCSLPICNTAAIRGCFTRKHVLGLALLWGWNTRVPSEKPLVHPGVVCLDWMLCMPSQHDAIGLQTDCMVVVPGPVMRLPDSHVYALWPWAMGWPPLQ